MSKKSILNAIILCLVGAHAFSQPSIQEADSVSSLPLYEIVVTGTRTEKRLSETPVLTTLISESEIKQAGATSALESLQDNIPGIVISPNAMGNNLRIRGLNSRYILFLVDGERLVSEGAGGNVNLDQIGVDNIQRIEMINGAASSLYGSNAVGAVVNVITKTPKNPMEVEVKHSVESNNTLRSGIELGSQLNRFTNRIGAFRNSSDGFGSDNSDAYAARYEDYGAHWKGIFNPSDNADIQLLAKYFSHETFNPDNSMNVKHAFTQNLTAGASGGLSLAEGKNSLRGSVHFDKYFDYDVMEKKQNQRNLKNDASYLSTRLTDTYSPSEQWEWIGGVEWNREENYATSTLGAVPTTKRLHDLNVFAQAEYRMLENLDVVAGGRYTRNSQFGSALTPKLSLMYEIGRFKFRGGVGTAFRAPSIKELYYDFDHQGMFWVYGNPDLKPEKGIHSSLSAEYTRGVFNTSLSVYHNKINDKITQYDMINELGGNEKYYRNVSSATLRGIDFTLAYILLQQLTLKGSYSFCDARDNATDLQLEDNVKHSGTVAVTWKSEIVKSPFSLQVAGRFCSPKLYQQIIADSDGNQQIEKSESKPMSVWKAALLKPFQWKKHCLELTLKVDNIFNYKDVSFIDSGRKFLVGGSYRF